MVGPNGKYGDTEVAAGIVGFADLTLGSDVARVLEAHLGASPNRFRGIRHSCTWDASPTVKTATPGIPRGLMADAKFRAGLACLQTYGLSFEAWLYHPQLPEVPALARAVPDLPIVLNHVGGLLGVGPYAGKREEIFDGWKRAMRDGRGLPERGGQAGRVGHGPVRLRVERAGHAAHLGGPRGRDRAVLPVLHRPVRPRPLHV